MTASLKSRNIIILYRIEILCLYILSEHFKLCIKEWMEEKNGKRKVLNYWKGWVLVTEMFCNLTNVKWLIVLHLLIILPLVWTNCKTVLRSGFLRFVMQNTTSFWKGIAASCFCLILIVLNSLWFCFQSSSQSAWKCQCYFYRLWFNIDVTSFDKRWNLNAPWKTFDNRNLTNSLPALLFYFHIM